jgi:hypothetical protein
LAAELDDLALHERNLLRRDLVAQIAAGDHDAIGGLTISSIFSTPSGFSIFGENGDDLAIFGEDVPDGQISSGRRQKEAKIASMSCSAAEFEVAFVLFGNIRASKDGHRTFMPFWSLM